MWPPTGIALAALLIVGLDAWPAIFLGAFVVNVTTVGTALSSAGIAAGNTLEAVLGAYLVNRWANGRRLCARPRDLVRFALLAAVASTTVAASVGVTTLSLLGVARWAAYGPVAIRGTLHGFGPFARPSANQSLLLLQAFTAVASLMTLIIAAVFARRRRAERWLRALSMSDPLTGLGNYRLLVEVVGREISRSQRTGRPFALMLLDLDGLKRINDRYGHLVGSRALCRVADVLRGTCRLVDTATRFGGDEFAVALPEADEDAAGRLAERVTAALATHRESPTISVSVGVAIYPRDGTSIEALLDRADRRLYADKARHRPGVSDHPRFG